MSDAARPEDPYDVVVHLAAQFYSFFRRKSRRDYAHSTSLLLTMICLSLPWSTLPRTRGHQILLQQPGILQPTSRGAAQTFYRTRRRLSGRYIKRSFEGEGCCRYIVVTDMQGCWRNGPHHLPSESKNKKMIITAFQMSDLFWIISKSHRTFSFLIPPQPRS